MNENNRYKATIAGKQYTIVGQKSTEHLNAVVEIVNQQLNQLHTLAPELSAADRSILMAVNAVSDQLTKEQQIMDLEDELSRVRSQVKASTKRNSAPSSKKSK